MAAFHINPYHGKTLRPFDTRYQSKWSSLVTPRLAPHRAPQCYHTTLCPLQKKWNNHMYLLFKEWSELQFPHNLYLKLKTSVPHRSKNSSEINNHRGVHKFPQNLEAITKFFVPERWPDASSILRPNNSGLTCEPHCHQVLRASSIKKKK